MAPPHSRDARDQLARSIEASLTRVAARGDREWSYADPRTGRRFELREAGDGEARVLLGEYVPNGRMVEVDRSGKVLRSWREGAIDIAERRHGPNGFEKAAEAMGLDRSSIVFEGTGYGLDSLYFETRLEAAGAIADALLGNVRHNPRREPGESERAARAIESHKSALAFWKAQQEALDRSMAAEPGIFKGCHTMLGAPLSKASKQAILGFLNDPGQERWLAARGTCIAGSATLWQAWSAVDPSAPESGSVGFPDPEILREAIRQAVLDRAAECVARLALAKANMAEDKLRLVDQGPSR